MAWVKVPISHGSPERGDGARRYSLRAGKGGLAYPKKHTGRPRIPYADAVEEALCFGWIDSNAKRIDGDTFAQRFSRRKGKGILSQANIERVRRLIRLGKMTPAGLAVIGNPLLLEEQDLAIAPDILEALKEDPQVWENFLQFPGIYKRIRVAYIEGGRRHGDEAFQRRLRNFVRKTRANKQFGFGGVQTE
ncbi:MAG: YdeI/OmpD-associated family protein [Methanomicrobiales archaeon]|nr:YdeI/OmpD-associated family protein [Methanomicrobiales archaeon]